MLDDDGICAIALKTATAVTFQVIFSGADLLFTLDSENEGEKTTIEARLPYTLIVSLSILASETPKLPPPWTWARPFAVSRIFIIQT